MADGATPEEAVTNARTIIDEWTMVARMDGRPVPEPQASDVPATA
jgi:predicted RNase H-like HicB family nuclease